MSGLRLAHPDRILWPASAGALAGIVLLGALPPARRKGSLTLVRDGLPNLPRPGPSSGACAGRVIPVCTENLNADVVMMKSAEYRV